ncbi:MAG TPA: hypothetical protein VGS13_07365 [Stellaceae bacterium]|nr:hypothetical protein [Stellaceae bacterium]
MKGPAWPLLIGVAMVLGVPDAASAQSQPRLTIVNQCKDPVWAVLTPGGNGTQGAALYNSGGWFQQYVTTNSGQIIRDQLPVFTSKNNSWAPTGFTGTIGRGSMTLMSTRNPNPSNFKVGQIIGIVGAGERGGNLITTILAVNGSSITLANAAQSAVTAPKSSNVYVPQQMAAPPIKSGGMLSLRIPNAGAPSVNLSFYLGCSGSPFASGTICKMGGVPGTQTSGINTLFEATFGCTTNPNSLPNQRGCAFNPSSPAPNCQAAPDRENCESLGFFDNYDVSAVDGYTLPMTIEVTPPMGATQGTCSGSAPITKIDASGLDLASCPSEDADTLFSTDSKQQTLIKTGISLLTQIAGQGSACVAPFHWFEPPGALGNPPVGANTTSPKCGGGKCTSVSYYAAGACDSNPANADVACPSGSGGQAEVGPHQNGRDATQNTHYVQRLHQMGVIAYSWQFDDAFALQSCPSSHATPTMSYAKYQVTLCPNGNTTPYDTKQMWEFSGGTCQVSASGTYQSLVACQQANLKYSCTDVTDAVSYVYADNKPVTAALWAPVSNGGIAYSRIPTPKVECGPPNSMIEMGSVKAPHCVSVYGAVGTYKSGTYESPCPIKPAK